MKKWMKKRWLWVLIIIAGVAGFYYYQTQLKQSESEIAIVTNETVAEKGDIKISLESDGQATINYTNIDFDISGRLSAIYVSAGQRVKKGQKLAEIDKETYEKAYQSAKIAYEKARMNYQAKQQSAIQDTRLAKSKVDEYKIKADQLEREYQVMLQLNDVYAVSEVTAKKSEWEAALRSYNNESASYQATSNTSLTLAIEQLNVETAKLQLETALENLEKTALYAPTDGLILKSDYRIGDMVTPMTDSGSLTASTNHLLVLTPAKNFQVLTSVSEQDLSMVSIGQVVEVVFDALPGESFTGQVTAIEALPNTDSSGVVSYNVTTELTSGFDQIKIGMTAQLELILKQEKAVIVIPNKAVSLKSGQQQVQIKKADGTFETRNIKAGLTDGRQVSVHEGLNAGEVVVYETTGK